uniref:DNA replication helicase n=1 Tax=Tanacetum cinerariifolium TaxID=118510 RepID=A0A6L2L9L6_TANCI|nr:DNA replication helicase [Tanacetum cinerariifolium]
MKQLIYEKMDEMKFFNLEAYDYLIQRNPNTWWRAFFNLDVKQKDIHNAETVFPGSYEELEVRCRDQAFRVNLGLKRCVCMLWQLSGVPCIQVVVRRTEPKLQNDSARCGGRGSKSGGKGYMCGGRGAKSGGKCTVGGVRGTIDDGRGAESDCKGHESGGRGSRSGGKGYMCGGRGAKSGGKCTVGGVRGTIDDGRGAESDCKGHESGGRGKSRWIKKTLGKVWNMNILKDYWMSKKNKRKRIPREVR